MYCHVAFGPFLSKLIHLYITDALSKTRIIFCRKTTVSQADDISLALAVSSAWQADLGNQTAAAAAAAVAAITIAAAEAAVAAAAVTITTKPPATRTTTVVSATIAAASATAGGLLELNYSTLTHLL